MSKGEQTKQLIIDRALTLAASIGLEQVTLGTLATDLELSKSGLFAHFKSKEALQLEVVCEVVSQFTRIVVMPALSQPRGVPRLTELFEGYVRWMSVKTNGTSGCIFVALTYEYDDRPGPVREAIITAQRDWLDSLARMAKSAIDCEAFAQTVDPKQFAFEFEGISMAHQFALKVGTHVRGAETLARRAFGDLIIRSLRLH